jgi:hypothetical protein
MKLKVGSRRRKDARLVLHVTKNPDKRVAHSVNDVKGTLGFKVPAVLTTMPRA